MSIGDLPSIEADPWVRFDMYADVFRDLACACVPKARRPENRP